MSKHQGKGSPSAGHQKGVAEQASTAHVHDVAAQHTGKTGALTPHEQSRQAGDRSQQTFVRNQEAQRDAAQDHAALHEEARPEDTAALAHSLWMARGCPQGSPQHDWFAAVEQMRTEAGSALHAAKR